MYHIHKYLYSLMYVYKCIYAQIWFSVHTDRDFAQGTVSISYYTENYEHEVHT